MGENILHSQTVRMIEAQAGPVLFRKKSKSDRGLRIHTYLKIEPLGIN